MKTPSEIFAVHGYFETLVQSIGDSFKVIGTREIPDPKDRPLGEAGARDYTLTESLTVQRGHKTVTVKATPTRPIKCRGYANATCGRALENK